MKRVLVLSYTDNPAEGHAFSRYKAIKAEGYETYFVSLVSEFTHDFSSFFMDGHSKWHFSYLLFKIKCKYNNIRSLSSARGKEERAFFNLNNYYVGDARRILEKIPVIPDIIIFGWCDFFISPKVLSDLYHITRAKIVISMVDAHILGGGCHYPCECTQYTSGCSSCNVLSFSEPARRLYEEKKLYLTDIPFVLVGTSYDLERAKNVPFLKNKKMLSAIGVPEIPFIKSKREARLALDFCEDDFIIMYGASSLKEKRKGFSYLLDALSIFSKDLNRRKVTVVTLGDGYFNKDMLMGMNVISLGFLSLERLFLTYYASDIFISTSIDDSGPYMINYSIACGTPVVSFPVGIALDLVKHGETGYLAKYLDSKDLALCIRSFYNMDKETYQVMSDNCIDLMEKLRKTQKPWYYKVLED